MEVSEGPLLEELFNTGGADDNGAWDGWDTDLAANAFCPTGEGGGVDSTCSPGGFGTGAKGLAKLKKPKIMQGTGLVQVPFRVAPQELVEKVEAVARKAIDADKGRTREIDVAKLISTQSAVRSESVKFMLGSKDDYTQEPIRVVEIKGEHYIFDGTHRATRDFLLGKRRVKAVVYK